MPNFQGATYFTMKGGLNTEASPLNIPPQDCTEAINIDFNIDGSIERRRAVDFVGESTGGNLYQTSAIADYSGRAEVPSFCQFNPTNDGGDLVKHVVLHLGNEFRFYDYDTPEQLKEIDNPKQIISTGFSDSQAFENTRFLKDENKIFVVNREHPFGYFEYDANLDTFSWSRLDAQYRLNDTVGETSTVTDIISDDSGFSLGCMSGSRVWLAGSKGKPSTIYFSQTIIDGAGHDKMYQEADPYDTLDNLLVDTDGGSITLTGAEKILALAPLGVGIIVFANNGVWSIAGQDGFRPTSYSINKISDIGIAGSDCWCPVEQQLVFFGTGNVYTILLGTSIDTPEVKPIGDKIVTLYNNMPKYNIESGKAVYDITSKKIYFYTNFTGYDWQTRMNPNSVSTISRDVLVMDVRLAAWSKYSLSADADGTMASIADAGVLDNGRVVEGNVLDNSGDTVTNELDELVTAQEVTETNSSYNVHVLIMKPDGDSWKVSFGEMVTSGLTDFEQSTEDAEDNASSITMAHQLFKDVAHKKFAPYLIPIFKRIESGQLVDGVDITPGGCKYRIDWDWATNGTHNKFGELRDAYRPYKWNVSLYDGGDPGTEIVTSRLKVRGRGDVLRIHFESDESKDFKLYGWQLMIHAKGKV